MIEEVRFAADSPLEGDGFEPSVPGTKEPVFVAESELRGPTGQPKRIVSYAVPMVRIHLPPAERWYGAGGEEMAPSSL